MNEEPEEFVDYFKIPPLRYLGYTNEVGEALRGIIPNWAVNSSYGVATTYVISHTFYRYLKVKKDETKPNESLMVGVDTFIWQMLASVIFPGYTINRSCFLARLALNRTKLPSQTRRIIVTSFGLILIPVIINPIDKSVDELMARFIRPKLLVIFKLKS